MSDLKDLIVRWHRGWSMARALSPAEVVDGGLRSHGIRLGRDVEYVATDADGDPASIARLAERVAGERAVTWLTVPTTDPAAAAAAVTAADLVLLDLAEKLMVIDLRNHPETMPAIGYQASVQVDAHHGGTVVTATVRHESGELAARGTMAVSGTDAVADRIETTTAHRRRGLASVIMGALTCSAIEQGARHGILVASADGQRLYTTRGWQPVADVLISTGSGTTRAS